jgi:hypothetical protein
MIELAADEGVSGEWRCEWRGERGRVDMVTWSAMTFSKTLSHSLPTGEIACGDPLS